MGWFRTHLVFRQVYIFQIAPARPNSAISPRQSGKLLFEMTAFTQKNVEQSWFFAPSFFCVCGWAEAVALIIWQWNQHYIIENPTWRVIKCVFWHCCSYRQRAWLTNVSLIFPFLGFRQWQMPTSRKDWCCGGGFQRKLQTKLHQTCHTFKSFLWKSLPNAIHDATLHCDVW